MTTPTRSARFPVALATLPFVLLSALPLASQEAGTYEHYVVHDTDNFPVTEYAARRGAILERLQPGEGVLLMSAPKVTRSHDIEYDYRQRSNLLYTTGITENHAALLLVRDGVDLGDTTVHEILFVAERVRTHEVWEGVKMGPEVASRLTGVAHVRGYGQIGRTLHRLLPRIGTLFVEEENGSPFRRRDTLEVVATALPTVIEPDSLHRTLPVLRNAALHLNPLREIKSPAELAMMQRAIDVTIEGHRRAMRAAGPGVAEYELEAAMEYAFLAGGAEGPAYPSIVGSGPNSCILHYSASRRRTAPGDLVLMDCGAEYRGYAADITRTFPVSGRFTPEQREIYELVLAAQNAGIDACRAGREFIDPHRAAQKVIADGLLRLGIIASAGEARSYTLHFTSHLLGLDVHDVGVRRTLEPGMVLTVEPGVYIPEGSPCDPKWWNIGVRIEDDVLVTDREPVNMSGELERSVEEIEGVVRGG